MYHFQGRRHMNVCSNLSHPYNRHCLGIHLYFMERDVAGGGEGGGGGGGGGRENQKKN